jgi:nucleoside-diphosphate-sugar epimerase
MRTGEHILITGGAGYIGSLLAGELLRTGYLVTVVDSLLYGGDGLLSYLPNPDFNFVKADVCDPGTLRLALRKDWPRPSAVVHLAALAGFPACQAVGQAVAYRFNVEATQRVFEQADQLEVERFVFPSTYSVYANDPGCAVVKEDSPLEAHSLYSETKIQAETWLRQAAETSATALVIYRQATTYGLSPRIRFDLLINQLILDAYIRRELVIYQRGYSRSFLHVRDAVRGYMLALQAPEEKIRNQVYNLGCDRGNYTKDEIVNLILERLTGVVVSYKDVSFGGEQRDLIVSYQKIEQGLGFEPLFTANEGVDEVINALRTGLIRNPYDRRYRNADSFIQ